MQLARRSDPIDHVVRTGPRKFLVGGVAVLGAGLIATNPVTSVVAEIQQRAVQLTSGIGGVLGDYEDVISQAVANLQTLGGEAEVAIPDLFGAIGADLSGYGDLISTGLSGTQTALQDALYGGFYGNDDGYVFGLIGGSLTDPNNGITETGSTLQEILTALEQGNLYNAFSYYDTWSLESLQHITKPLLSPFLSTAHGAATPTPTIEGELLQTFTNVVERLLTYSDLQSLVKALLSPELGVTFGLLGDLGKIGGDVSSGNIAGALADVLNVPADLTGDLLNGYVNPDTALNPSGEAFTGLLNSGSLLELLLVTWPTDLANALALPTTPEVAAAVDPGVLVDAVPLVDLVTAALTSF